VAGGGDTTMTVIFGTDDEREIGLVGSVTAYWKYDDADWLPPKKRKSKLPFGFCIERATTKNSKRKR
jgi:hypothetical protein